MNHQLVPNNALYAVYVQYTFYSQITRGGVHIKRVNEYVKFAIFYTLHRHFLDIHSGGDETN